MNKVVHGTLYCGDPNCGFTKKVVLVRRDGVFKINKYRCGECFSPMSIEVTEDELRAGSDKSDVAGTPDSDIQTG